MPDLVTTLMTAPPARPYSAENEFELTWNSFTASWLNWYGARPEPVRPSGLAEERVVVVGAVDDQAVERAALAGEADVAGAHVARDAGREQREVDEVAAVDRQVLHRPFR